MSRWISMAIVATLIAALTVTAFFITTSGQSKAVRKDRTDLVIRAQKQIWNAAKVEGVKAQAQAEKLASKREIVEALRAIYMPKAERGPDEFKTLNEKADFAVKEFKADESDGDAGLTDKADFALIDVTGEVMYLHGVRVPTGSQYKDGDGRITIPALAYVLPDLAPAWSNAEPPEERWIAKFKSAPRRAAISEIARMPSGLARIAVAPVIERIASQTGVVEDVIVGVVLISTPISSEHAQRQDELTGVRVGYFDARGIAVSSFQRGNREENTELRDRLAAVVADKKLAETALDITTEEMSALMSLDLGGAEYLAGTVRLPITGTVRETREAGAKATASTYQPQRAGAVVLVAPGEFADEVTGTSKTFILLVGAGALVLALLGMYLVHHRMEMQIDEIELGVAEIINGNLDRTFRPVGAELDGLANGLNVMLARLLGRPEPGEEAFDENGNPVIPGRIDFEEAPDADAAPPAPDPELAALAQEPEPDYYKRLFTEYGQARRDSGSPDDVSFESFIAKLRVNEGKLRAQYNCRAVRFRVVTKDGKVSLKPVPIF